MKTLKIPTQNIPYLLNTLFRAERKESNNSDFIRWILIWYVGSSILLLLSLHSYFMGFSK